MIPIPYRTKGGAPLLGASRADEPGPFGSYTDDEEDDATAADIPKSRNDLTAPADFGNNQAEP